MNDLKNTPGEPKKRVQQSKKTQSPLIVLFIISLGIGFMLSLFVTGLVAEVIGEENNETIIVILLVMTLILTGFNYLLFYIARWVYIKMHQAGINPIVIFLVIGLIILSPYLIPIIVLFASMSKSRPTSVKQPTTVRTPTTLPPSKPTHSNVKPSNPAKNVPINHTICFKCYGSGKMPCPACGGKGLTVQATGDSGNVGYRPCPLCDGKHAQRCNSCDGRGKVYNRRS